MTKSAISAIEKVFVKTGRIASARAWHGGNIQELHLHLPDVNFDAWEKAQSIKCRISALHYTDYTPAVWDAGEKTCTLYIDTSHGGRGSAWAKRQKRGDDFHYLAIEEEMHAPVDGKRHIFLGDQTAIGHFCAIRQLASAEINVSGCMVFNDLTTANGLAENCPWLPVKCVTDYRSLIDHAHQLAIQIKTDQEKHVFYVVGNAQLIVSVRKLLKTHGIDGSRIKSKGFWK
jgi:NADPH-dependent ferric siderophore reductase